MPNPRYQPLICTWCKREFSMYGPQYRSKINSGQVNFFCNSECFQAWHHKPDEYAARCAWCLVDIKVLGRIYRDKIKNGQSTFFCNGSCRARYHTWLRDKERYGRRKA